MDSWGMILPAPLRELVEGLPDARRAQVEELRLREGSAIAAITAGEEWTDPAWRDRILQEEDLRRVLERAGGGSLHTILSQLREGFVTAAGGVRIGICGEVAVEQGILRAFRKITSLSLRVPHTLWGVARPLVPALLKEGRLQSTLILSPPGQGKTTLLRDLIRCISEGEGLPPLRVGVADERGELGAGGLRRQLGRRTDVMEYCPKALALEMLLRTMNPQVLAVDEITAPGDVQAIEEAEGCGVLLLATAHGENLEELRRRAVYRPLLERGTFQRFLLISIAHGRRQYQVKEWEKLPC